MTEDPGLEPIEDLFDATAATGPVTAGGGSSTSSANQGAAVSIQPFVMQRAQRTTWCWAAVAVSVHGHYNSASLATVSPQQCEVVNAVFPGNNCCQSPVSPACNQPGQLDRALNHVGHLHVHRSGTARFARILREVSAAPLPRPVCGRAAWTGGHFFVIHDCDANTQDLDIDDPHYGPSTVNYHALIQSGYRGLGAWSDTYLTQ